MSFRVRFQEDAYPISRFIVERANQLGLDRKAFAGRLGYKNFAKACKALDQMLVTGAVPSHALPHLAIALAVDGQVLDQVLLMTERQHEDEARASRLERERQYTAEFRPYLRAVTERTRPEPIFVAALVGTRRLLGVELSEDAIGAAPAERDRLVRTAILDHYDEHHGLVPAFGRITGYVLALRPGYLSDLGIRFGVAGEALGPLESVGRMPGEASLGMKRGDGRLTKLLRDRPVKVVQV